MPHISIQIWISIKITKTWRGSWFEIIVFLPLLGTFLNFHTNMVLSIESKMDRTSYWPYHSYKTGTRLVLPQVPTTRLYLRQIWVQFSSQFWFIPLGWNESKLVVQTRSGPRGRLGNSPLPGTTNKRWLPEQRGRYLKIFNLESSASTFLNLKGLLPFEGQLIVQLTRLWTF